MDNENVDGSCYWVAKSRTKYVDKEGPADGAVLVGDDARVVSRVFRNCHLQAQDKLTLLNLAA